MHPLKIYFLQVQNWKKWRTTANYYSTKNTKVRR